MISRLVLKTEKGVHNYIKSGFSPVHIVSPIAVSKSFPYNLDIESNKSMCTVRPTSNGRLNVLVIEGNSFNCVLFPSESQVKNQEAWVFVLSNLPICQLFGTPVHCLEMTQDFYLRWAPLRNL